MKVGCVSQCHERGLWINTRAVVHHFRWKPQYLSFSRQQPVHPEDFPMQDITYGKEHAVKWAKKHKFDLLVTWEGVYLPGIKEIRKHVGKMIDFVDWEMLRPKHKPLLSTWDELWVPTPKIAQLIRRFHPKVTILSDVDWAFDLERKPKSYGGTVSLYHNCGWGGLQARKNTEQVLKAFVRMGDSKTILLVTAQGNQKYFSQYASAPNITISIGSVTRSILKNIYYAHHILVQPSKREGLGLPLYEGMKAGCVVVTTDAPPMNEIRGGVKNIFVPVAQKKKIPNSFVPLYEVAVLPLSKSMAEAVTFVRAQ